MNINNNYNQSRTNFNVDFYRTTSKKRRQVPIKSEERVNIEINEKPRVKRKIINIQK